MELRKSSKSDVENIMKIIHQAQDYFKKNGIDQWQNNYPSEDTILHDINNKISYVLIKDDKIVGTAAISFDKEITYDIIYDGNWISNDKYAVIHRIAIDNEHKGLGLASIILKNVEDMCINKNIKSIKIDTHEQNLSMQKLIKKSGFEYCGVIYLEDRSKRLVFEKTL